MGIATFDCATITRRVAMTQGITDLDLRRMAASGEWFRLRPGGYATLPESRVSVIDRHALAIRETIPLAAPDAVVSHVSAAVLHDLPIWRAPLDRVQVSRPGSGGGHRRRLLHTHRASLGPEEVVLIGDIRATSAARTVIDLALALEPEDAIIAGDAALRMGIVTTEQLATALQGAARRHGARKARTVVPLLNGRSESPGESRSRWLLHRQSVPTPALQYEVFGLTGEFIGRADFAWVEQRVLGEFDGADKYSRFVGAGESPGEVVFREKRREDLLRAAGWIVVRWTWADLADPERLTRRIQQALTRTWR